MTEPGNHVVSIEHLQEIPLYDVAEIADTTAETVREKLIDAFTPGYQVEFDPEEAAMAGAFLEDALSEGDAAESDIDLVDAAVPTTSSEA